MEIIWERYDTSRLLLPSPPAVGNLEFFSYLPPTAAYIQKARYVCSTYKNPPQPIPNTLPRMPNRVPNPSQTLHPKIPNLHQQQ